MPDTTIDDLPSPESLQLEAQASKSWAFDEARALHKRLQKHPPKNPKKEILFETGFGASGLPHLGTFGEVARTTMVRHAFATLAPDIPTRLICFSDDMDGLRKVPENIPEQDMLAQHLQQPLTSIPDPFGTHDSFGAHNNARLQSFLDRFGFSYEFASATHYYKAGKFDETLLLMLRHYQGVLDIILPTLGAARRETYSPFLPICPATHEVLMVATTPLDVEKGLLGYTHPHTGKQCETLVTGGACKLQWKADWAMRWVALGVDYEMAGKDLSESVALSGRIAKLLGTTPPTGFSYELFLDDKGEKISKTKGNGISLDEWLRYAPPESLSLYMYQHPRKAKRLHFDVIPKAVDEYLTHLAKYATQDTATRLNNPVWHIHNGVVESQTLPISFALLLNLAIASNANSKDILWGFITQFAPTITPESQALLYRLVDYALAYYQDFVAPHKTYRTPNAAEKKALTDLQAQLKSTLETETEADPQALQNIIYAVGTEHYGENQREWFQTLYQTLLGQEQGPRFGSFVALYGLEKTNDLIQQALGRD